MAPGEPRFGPGFKHRILNRVCSDTKVACDPIKFTRTAGVLARLGAGWEKHSIGWAARSHVAVVQDRLFPNARNGEGIGQAGAVDGEVF